MTDSEYIDANCIRVVLAKLPGNVKAFSLLNADSYTVAVNTDLGPVEQLDAIRHELAHIKRGDHYNPDYWEYS